MSAYANGMARFEHLKLIGSNTLFEGAVDSIPINVHSICTYRDQDSLHLSVDRDGDGVVDTIVTIQCFAFASTGVGSSLNPIPSEFAVYQNYPNPFNPSTTIRYAIPHRSHVTLSVFNTLGQQVAQLVNADIDAGYHEIQFNATNLASGVYFYRMQAGSYVETKKLLLVR